MSSVFDGTKTAKVNGTTLAYREQGEGEPVVFVHGALSDLRTWEQQLPSIGASCRAIAYSRRYARPNEDIDPEADDQILPHVDDLAAFLQAIDAAPAHLVGSSWGGFVSLLTAIRYPETVRSLVLEEPPVVPLLGFSLPPKALEVVSLLVRHPRFALTMAMGGAVGMVRAEKAFRRGDNATGMRSFLHAALGDETYRWLPEARIQQARENLSTIRAQMLGAGFPPLGEEEVRGVTAPTLIVTGERSPPAALLLMDRLEELLPNVERLAIPDASHLMHEENAPAVNQAILGFLAANSR